MPDSVLRAPHRLPPLLQFLIFHRVASIEHYQSAVGEVGEGLRHRRAQADEQDDDVVHDVEWRYSCMLGVIPTKKLK